ncbi:bacteriocin-like protein [Chryseobacterium sp. S-02]|uniref:bacteriocin-like protein n=1 Tax=Chryseobacterium sp. S-02 TaxID=3404064 RepID=UPI003CF00FEF
MKNLKKLNKSQLKAITGAGGIKTLPEPEFCMYACPDGTIVCATCSNDFKCPDNSI